MSLPPALLTEPTPGIAALIGEMLGALLYAVFGWMRRNGAGTRAAALEGTLAAVLEAEAAISFEVEPYVEWVAVPAPWRNGRLLPARHRRALSVALPWRFVPAWVVGRGPPWAGFRFGAWGTGMA